MEKPDIVVICGPTGIGKTACAIRVAKAVNGRIINADSMQIYRYMDIGTAKPTMAERNEIPHAMVNIIDPDDEFDAARFSEMADGFIKDFTSQGFVPIVAGGTGLYIKALVSGLFRARPADKAVIDRLTRDVQESGADVLHDRLTQIDPKAGARIHPNDSFRIIRALEIYETTGKPISEYHEEHRFSDQPYRALKIGLSMDRDILYGRINQRVDLMMEQGFLNEVESLMKMGYSPSLKSMGSLGYRHMAAYLGGTVSYEDSVALLKRDTRRYAKRQLTWFRADSEIEWFEPSNHAGLVHRVLAFLHRDEHERQQ